MNSINTHSMNSTSTETPSVLKPVSFESDYNSEAVTAGSFQASVYKTMSDDQLIKRVEYLVRRERELVECLIWHLQEIQNRQLFIQMGFTSLFECLVKHFKYSEAMAYSRISALKIINAVPEAAEALNSGEVNVTTLSLTQSFIRKQEKESGEKVSLEQKVQYLNSIKNKTVQETKQILATLNPVPEFPIDKVQYLDHEHAQLQITVNKTVLEKFEKLKSLISHKIIDANFSDLLNVALEAAIESIEKKKGFNSQTKGLSQQIEKAKNTQNVEPATSQINNEVRSDIVQNSNSNSKATVKATVKATEAGGCAAVQLENTTQSFAIKSSRYVSRKVKRAVRHRSQGQCEYVHSDGQRCASKFQLQFDHRNPFSKGGGSELNNIQNLCRVHNAYKGTS